MPFPAGMHACSMYHKGSPSFVAFVLRDMERLMGRIADQIADKVQEQRSINFISVFVLLWKSGKVGQVHLWLLRWCLLEKRSRSTLTRSCHWTRRRHLTHKSYIKCFEPQNVATERPCRSLKMARMRLWRFVWLRSTVSLLHNAKCFGLKAKMCLSFQLTFSLIEEVVWYLLDHTWQNGGECNESASGAKLTAVDFMLSMATERISCWLQSVWG